MLQFPKSSVPYILSSTFAAAAVLLAASPASAQQGSVQIVSATQIATGDELRLGGQRRVEPDLGLLVLQPGLRIGTLHIDLHATTRGNRATLGRALFSVSDLKARGLLWNISAGDTSIMPAVSELAFANLFAPAVTFQGASVGGQSKTVSVSGAAGRVTVLRNIFGSDADALDQTMAVLRVRHQPSTRWTWSARASHVRSGDLKEFTSYVRSSQDVGGGAQYRSGSIELVVDGGFSAYRRVGATADERQPSYLVGAIWTGRQGWLQLNAQRFSIARLPVLNFPYNDREGVFVTSERDVGSAVRLFGGGEAVRTNLDPQAAELATVSIPRGTQTRAFGGARFRIGDRSFVSGRFEGGDRAIRPSRFTAGFQSDSEVITGEWHGAFSQWNASVRYERRSSADLLDSAGSFKQHDASAHMFYSVSGSQQVFTTALVSRRNDGDGGGLFLWQASAGAQWQLPRRPVFGRVEVTSSRMRELLTQLITTRNALNVGLSTPLGQRTTLTFDVYVDRTPVMFATASPWLTRSMIRLTRSFATGTARTAGPPGVGAWSGPTGSIAGTVFVDWNGNGMQEAGEEPVGGIVVALGTFANVQTGGDGRFTFVSVPVGEQVVGLDLSALPATYDPPPNPSTTVSVSRGKPIATTIGVVPLGTIRGRVYQDVNGDGRLGAEDQPIEAAVALLDEGARSERARNGRFEFDGVRPGTHQVELVLESLPEGALLTGERSVPVELSRDQMVTTVDFLVRVDKRPEIKKVFPIRK